MLVITTKAKMKKNKMNYQGEEFRKEEDSFLYVLKPNEISLDNKIIIPEEFKESVIYKELNPEIRRKLGNLAGKGALVYGFPGVGKTSLVKQMAKDENAYIVWIEKDMSVSEIREAFNEARKISKNNKVFVVVDEIDDFGSKERAKYTGGLSKIIALMTEIEGIKTNNKARNNMYIIGITNYLEEVDHRLLRPGRLEEMLEVPFPSKKERGNIIDSLAKEVEDEDKILRYKEIIARKTNAYTPADLRGIIKHCQILIGEKGELSEGDLLNIITKFKPSVKRSFVNFEEPQISLDNIVGREFYIDFFKEVMEKGKEGNATFLLYGLRGVGKTIFPEALANYFEYSFIKVRGSELQEGIVGEGTKNLKRLFNAAKLSAPCVVLLDEIEGMITKRGTISHKDDETAYINAVVGDMLERHEGIYLFATTNDALAINPTTLTRFQYKVAFELPSEDEREHYFTLYLNKEVNGHAKIAAKLTGGFSFKDLYFLTQGVNEYGNRTNAGKLLTYVIEKYKASNLIEDGNFEKTKEYIGDSLEIKKFVSGLKNEI